MAEELTGAGRILPRPMRESEAVIDVDGILDAYAWAKDRLESLIIARRRRLAKALEEQGRTPPDDPVALRKMLAVLWALYELGRLQAIQEADHLGITIDLPAPPSARAYAKNPEFEKKHDRDSTGRFGKKGERILHGVPRPRGMVRPPPLNSPGVEGLMADIGVYLASIGLPIPPFDIAFMTPEDEERWKGATGGIPAGYAVPGHVVLARSMMGRLGAMVRARRTGAPVDRVLTRILLHEALHQIRHSAEAVNDPTFNARRSTVEGFTDAVAADLMQNFAAKVFGAKTAKAIREERAREGSTPLSYPAEVGEVRRRSMRATGKPWHSPAAFAWRVKMLLANPDEFLAEWARAALLPMPRRTGGGAAGARAMSASSQDHPALNPALDETAAWAERKLAHGEGAPDSLAAPWARVRSGLAVDDERVREHVRDRQQ